MPALIFCTSVAKTTKYLNLNCGDVLLHKFILTRMNFSVTIESLRSLRAFSITE